MLRFRRRWALSTCVSTLLVGPVANADELYLADGSRLKGDIVEFAEGELRVTTSFAGELTVEADAIAGIDTDGKMRIALDSGDQLAGALGFSRDGGQRLQNPLLGNVALAPGHIEAMWSPEAESPAVARANQAHTEALAELSEQVITAEDAWSGSIRAGLEAASGNSDRFSWNGRAEATRESAFDRISMFLQGRVAEEDGVETENEQSAGARLEHDLSPRVFTFGNVKLERDEFEELDLRTVLSGGAGYFLIEEADQVLKSRAGLGWQQESFENGNSSSQMIFSLGYDYEVAVNGWLEFVHELTLLPELTDPTGDYRVESRAVFELLTDDLAPWSVSVGLENEYNAAPRAGVDKLDSTYFLDLGYDFE